MPVQPLYPPVQIQPPEATGWNFPLDEVIQFDMEFDPGTFFQLI
jgi:hypothetical protein